MLKIVYSEKGRVVSDFSAHRYSEDIINTYLKNKNNMTIEVGTELMFTYFVIAAMEHRFADKEVSFWVNDKECQYDDVHGVGTFKDNTEIHSIYADTVMYLIDIGYKNLLAK